MSLSTTFTRTLLATVCAAGLTDRYQLTQTQQIPDPVTNQPTDVVTPVRSGAPLNSNQEAAVQASIDLIADWEAHCGITADGAGAGTETMSEQLQEMLDNGEICAETVAPPEKVGASASNPVTGNGPATLSNGDVVHWATEGHPGINIQPHLMVPPDPQAPPGVQADTAWLAGMLIHESSHLTNPNNNATSACEYESRAHAHLLDQLCLVLSCSQAQSSGAADHLCLLMQDAYYERLGCGQLAVAGPDRPMSGSYVECAACPMIPPGTPGSPSGGESVAGSVFQALAPQAYLGEPPTDALFTRLFVGGPGTLVLDRTLPRLRIQPAGASAYEVGPGDFGTHGVVPVCFVQVSPTRILVGGTDPSGSHGTLLSVEHEVGTGVTALTPLGFTGTFTVATEMVQLPGTSRFAILDTHDAALYEFDLRTPEVRRIADTQDSAAMTQVAHVEAYRSRAQDGTPTMLLQALSVGESDLGSAPLLVQHQVRLYDIGVNGTYDVVR